MLFKKPLDFVHNGFDGDLSPKYVEICSRKKNTVSLTNVVFYRKSLTILLLIS